MDTVPDELFSEEVVTEADMLTADLQKDTKGSSYRDPEPITAEQLLDEPITDQVIEDDDDEQLAGSTDERQVYSCLLVNNTFEVFTLLYNIRAVLFLFFISLTTFQSNSVSNL